jgi:sulfur carrier protein ThiS
VEVREEVNMSETKTSIGEISVHLAYAGAGEQVVHLSEGATVADLLRLAGSSATGQAVYVDGVSIEDTIRLHDGAVVTIVSAPGQATGAGPWHATVPAFCDDSLFLEYAEALKSRRVEVGPEEDRVE